MHRLLNIRCARWYCPWCVQNRWKTKKISIFYNKLLQLEWKVEQHWKIRYIRSVLWKPFTESAINLYLSLWFANSLSKRLYNLNIQIKKNIPFYLCRAVIQNNKLYVEKKRFFFFKQISINTLKMLHWKCYFRN